MGNAVAFIVAILFISVVINSGIDGVTSPDATANDNKDTRGEARGVVREGQGASRVVTWYNSKRWQP